MSSRMVGQRTRGDEYNEIERRKIELEEQLLDLQEKRLDIEQKRIELELRKLKLAKGKSSKGKRSKRSSSQAPREESGDEIEPRDPRRLVSSADSDDDDEYLYDDSPRSNSRRREHRSRSRSYDNASTDGMTTDEEYNSYEDDDGVDEDDLLQEVPKTKKMSRSASSASETGEAASTILPPSGRGGKPLKRNPSARDIAEASTLPPLPGKPKALKRASTTSPPNTPKDADANLSGTGRNKNGISTPEPLRRRRSSRRGSAPSLTLTADENDRRGFIQRYNSAKGEALTQDSERSLGSEDTEKRSNTR